MGVTTERLLKRWKCLAALATALAAILLVVLVVTVVVLRRPRSDERLLGTWQSDADRTIAALRERGPVDENQEAALRKLFGKLRITYTPTAYTTELDGVTESNPYEVLGRDRLSVVIREVPTKPSPLELTEFTVIHFDGPDAYWLYTKVGDIQEYFKRVR
jgi:hypothetical protein